MSWLINDNIRYAAGKDRPYFARQTVGHQLKADGHDHEFLHGSLEAGPLFAVFVFAEFQEGITFLEDGRQFSYKSCYEFTLLLKSLRV